MFSCKLYFKNIYSFGFYKQSFSNLYDFFVGNRIKLFFLILRIEIYVKKKWNYVKNFLNEVPEEVPEVLKQFEIIKFIFYKVPIIKLL